MWLTIRTSPLVLHLVGSGPTKIPKTPYLTHLGARTVLGMEDNFGIGSACCQARETSPPDAMWLADPSLKVLINRNAEIRIAYTHLANDGVPLYGSR